jgi:hypothetical protein
MVGGGEGVPYRILPLTSLEFCLVAWVKNKKCVKEVKSAHVKEIFAQ